MQQATWQNRTIPKQMTFGVILEVGQKFNREKVLSVNSGLANGGIFSLQLGVSQGCCHPVPASEKPYWVEGEGKSALFSLCQKLPKHCHRLTLKSLQELFFWMPFKSK